LPVGKFIFLADKREIFGILIVKYFRVMYNDNVKTQINA